MLNWWEYDLGFGFGFESHNKMMDELKKTLLKEEKFGAQFDHKQWSFLQNDN